MAVPTEPAPAEPVPADLPPGGTATDGRSGWAGRGRFARGPFARGWTTAAGAGVSAVYVPLIMVLLSYAHQPLRDRPALYDGAATVFAALPPLGGIVLAVSGRTPSVRGWGIGLVLGWLVWALGIALIVGLLVGGLYLLKANHVTIWSD